jgi:hypothetical protein
MPIATASTKVNQYTGGSQTSASAFNHRPNEGPRQEGGSQTSTSAISRWLNESPRQEHWNSIRGLGESSGSEGSRTSKSLRAEQTIKEGGLRVLAQEVYAALGAAEQRSKK